MYGLILDYHFYNGVKVEQVTEQQPRIHAD